MDNALRKKDIYFEIKPQELRRFNTFIDDMVTASGRSYQKVVRNTARDVTRKAMNMQQISPVIRTIKGKGLRSITSKSLRKGFRKRNVNTETNRLTEKVFWIKTTHNRTGEKVVFPGTLSQAERYSSTIRGLRGKGLYQGDGKYKVNKRGFLKAAWVAALGKLGINVDKSVGSADRFGQIEQRGGAKSPNFIIKIKNAIPFALEFDKGRNRWKTPQHLVERAIRGVMPKFAENLKKAIAKRNLKQGL